MNVAPTRTPRRGYLDWLRGLAVLVMIEAHILDSWTRYDQRDSAMFGASMILGGLGALCSCFSPASRFRCLPDRSSASRSSFRRPALGIP